MPVCHPIKFVFLGDCGVGKSSLFGRLINGRFPVANDSTLGAAYMEVYISEFEDGRLELSRSPLDLNARCAERVWRVCVWDTAGQERYRSLLPMYYRGANVVAVVHDNTPEAIRRAKESLSEMELLWEKTGLALSMCQNKSDLPGAEYNTELANDPRVVHAAHVSAATGSNVVDFFLEACKPYIVHKGAAGDILLEPTTTIDIEVNNRPAARCCRSF